MTLAEAKAAALQKRIGRRDALLITADQAGAVPGAARA